MTTVLEDITHAKVMRGLTPYSCPGCGRLGHLVYKVTNKGTVTETRTCIACRARTTHQYQQHGRIQT